MSYPDVAWMDTAACTRPDNHKLPWLAEPEKLSADDRERPRHVCAGRPSTVPCVLFAVHHHVSAGFWSGTHRGTGELVQLTLDLGPLGELT